MYNRSILKSVGGSAMGLVRKVLIKNKVEYFKVLFAFLFILLFQNTANSSEITFAAISDSCIKSDKVDNSMTPSIQKLLRARGDINNSGSDFVLFLGNNISGADKYNLVMFAKIIKKIQKPVYTAIGNKDVQKTKHLDKTEYYKLLNRFSKNKVSKVPSIKHISGYIFIFMDGTNEMVSLPRGYYKDRELIILEKYLNKYKNKDVIIVQHYPLIGIEDNLKATYNAEPYKLLIAKHKNIKAIISGHDNKDFEIEDENGIKHINIPSLSEGAEYKVITINMDGDKTSVRSKIISVE